METAFATTGMGVIDPLRPAARTLWSTGVRAARALRTRSLFIKQIYRDPYWHKLSTAERVRCYRYGFKPRLFALYDFETYDRDAYLNYFETDRHSNITSYDVSGNKYSFDRILRQEFAEFLPEVYAVVKTQPSWVPDRRFSRPISTTGWPKRSRTPDDSFSSPTARTAVRTCSFSAANTATFGSRAPV